MRPAYDTYRFKNAFSSIKPKLKWYNGGFVVFSNRFYPAKQTSRTLQKVAEHNVHKLQLLHWMPGPQRKNPIPLFAKVFRCDMCDYFTDNKSNYNKHRKRHIGRFPTNAAKGDTQRDCACHIHSTTLIYKSRCELNIHLRIAHRRQDAYYLARFGHHASFVHHVP